MRLNLGPFNQDQSVINIHAKVPHCVLDLAVSEQDLDCAQIARRFVDHRCFCSAERVRSILPAVQADGGHPFVNQPRILSCAEVSKIIHAAWKHGSWMLPPRRLSHFRRLARQSFIISN